MLRKLLLSILIGFISITVVNSQVVKSEDAIKFAETFLRSRVPDSQEFPFLIKTLTDENNLPAIYIFKLSEKGFILISAEKAAIPVLGYSTADNWFNGDLPEHIDSWITGYLEQISKIRALKLQPDVRIINAWQHPENRYNLTPDKNLRSIEPLTISYWNQGGFFNDSCPVVSQGPGGHGWGGCVPVAMAQVLFYHRYPVHGTGYHSYTQNPIGTLSADFENTYYNWEAMLCRPDRHSPSLAQLIFHCGVAVDAIYTTDGTNAETSQTVIALSQYFNYSPDAEFHYKIEYTDSLWKEMIKANLILNRPLIYRGSMGWIGHAWVCDGYEGEDFFHFNWGWGGFANGYYYLNNLNPGNYEFNSGQGAVFNIYPAEILPPPIETDTVLTSSGSICNKRWPEPDFDDYSHQWLILPSESNSGYFQLLPEMMNLMSGDSILIYSGTEPSDEPAGIFTSDISPEVIHLQGTAAIIKSVNHSGMGKWALSYLAFKNKFCSLNTTQSGINRYLYDGSGNFFMNPGTNCSWVISPGNSEIDSVKSIEADFYKFLIGSRDTVIIYDGPDTNSPILNILTGDSIPGHIRSTGNKLLIRFMTDTLSQTAEGIEVAYTSVLPEYCAVDSIITAGSGILSNGSNGHNYHNNTLCSWLIEPENAESITFTFNSLNTETNRDRVEFYKASANPEQLVSMFSGNETPAPFTIKDSKVRVIFRSDYSIPGTGWELGFQSHTVGIEELPSGTVKYYPVPVFDVLNIEMPASFINGEYVLYNSTGSIISIGKTGNNAHFSIGTANLPEGIYMVTIQDQSLNFRIKFVKAK